MVYLLVDVKFKIKKRDNLDDLGVDGRIILKYISRKQVWRLWAGLICFRIGISGGLL
jgi:hypothetical protein